MKLIDKHFEWMEKGKLPDLEGLCNVFDIELNPNMLDYYLTFKLLEPIDEDKLELSRNDMPTIYWGKMNRDAVQTDLYNSFRQTIVLFICAMHGEI